MRYVYELTIPADTLLSAPEQANIRLVTGTLQRIEIAFPPGPAWMVKVVIRDRILQISPINSEMFHAWDDYTEVFSMNYPLDDPAPELTLVGWSPNTLFPHTVTFRFDVVPKSGDDKQALLAYLANLVAVPKR
jgi:hypothetical protein